MINLIAACDLNRAIGHKNDLLIKLPNDLKRFKELTSGQYCVFGRKTFESLPKQPLPNRHNIILTRNNDYQSPLGVYTYQTLESVIFEYREYNDNDDELFICGGEQVYKQALEYADRIYLTIIDHAFTKADAFFPEFDISDWKVIDHEQRKMDNEHLYNYHFVTYERKIKNK
jgi:dihydrofolate reductase